MSRFLSETARPLARMSMKKRFVPPFLLGLNQTHPQSLSNRAWTDEN